MTRLAFVGKYVMITCSCYARALLSHDSCRWSFLCIWSCVANECLMVQMHVSYESDVLYICVSDSCGGFLYAPTIFDVWFLCFFVGSFWLKLGSDIKCQPNFSL